MSLYQFTGDQLEIMMISVSRASDEKSVLLTKRMIHPIDKE